MHDNRAMDCLVVFPQRNLFAWISADLFPQLIVTVNLACIVSLHFYFFFKGLNLFNVFVPKKMMFFGSECVLQRGGQRRHCLN